MSSKALDIKNPYKDLLDNSHMFSSSNLEVNQEQLDCPGHLHSHFSDAKPLLWWNGFRGDLTSPRSVRSPWADGQACHLCHTCMPSLELK